MKIIVIGSIGAGVSAASRISSGERNAQITVYERSSFYSCGTGGLPHYLGEPVSQLNEAIRCKEEELRQAGIQAFLRHEVRKIDASARQVTVTDLATGREFTDKYDKLIIATGTQSRIPEIPGSHRMGVHTLKNVEDLIFLKELTRTPYVRDVVILGGNIHGLELAKVFLKMGRNVHVIEKESQLLPQFDLEVSKLIRQGLEEQGITFHVGEQVRALPGRTFVEEVRTTKGTYPCDLCMVADFDAPNTALVSGTGVRLDGKGRILIDGSLATNVPGIYAVGDCAACKEGSLRSFSLRVGELELARTGLTEAESRKAGLRVKSVMASAADRPGICPNPQKITIKLIYEASTRQVVGAQAWGGKNVSTRINAIAVAIRAGMTVEALSQVDFVYSSAATSIWDPIQVVCDAAK